MISVVQSDMNAALSNAPTDDEKLYDIDDNLLQEQLGQQEQEKVVKQQQREDFLRVQQEDTFKTVNIEDIYDDNMIRASPSSNAILPDSSKYKNIENEGKSGSFDVTSSTCSAQDDNICAASFHAQHFSFSEQQQSEDSKIDDTGEFQPMPDGFFGGRHYDTDYGIAWHTNNKDQFADLVADIASGDYSDYEHDDKENIPLNPQFNDENDDDIQIDANRYTTMNSVRMLAAVPQFLDDEDAEVEETRRASFSSGMLSAIRSSVSACVCLTSLTTTTSGSASEVEGRFSSANGEPDYVGEKYAAPSVGACGVDQFEFYYDESEGKGVQCGEGNPMRGVAREKRRVLQVW